MSEQQSLIPNLNEIIEEYAEMEEGITLKLQTTEIQYEVPEERVETEAQTEEGRKRKKNEEGETEQSKEDEVDEFVSNRV